MNPTEVTYPVFEANQVLSNAHLNDLFEYLDEQTRLTRSNLIGIGIACGLEVTFEAPGTVGLSKGCGVTSQGYLIVEPDDLDLAFVRPYTLPVERGYPPFVESGTNPAEQFDLWELFPDDDEPGAQPLATSGLVLDDKAVLLFLELRQDGLRNCSPNNCDDRGAEVTATVRRLLIDVTDLDKVIATTSAAAAETYLGADLTERLALPDLRMPRFDVPDSGPIAPEKVLYAFQATFRQDQLAAATAAALSKLYEAFKPLVVGEYPTDPFSTFTNRFGFLDATPATAAQVRFMQYYWDFFDDLLKAYDELRWKGLDLMCACCPPEGLFPRHLMAGVLDPTAYDAADYRHRFVPSPAVGDCESCTQELLQFFRRLVAMVESFTETPPDRGIRATPSRWGDAPISARAIPYYYDQDGTPPMFELWDPVKTERRRANQNLGYRAEEYSPAPPDFVADPLRFDLEPNNFVRIEGHHGKNVHDVLESLLSLKKTHRLPIQVIALRTGAFDENIEVDLSKEKCRFQDLDTLYAALKSELDCFLVKQVKYFYALPDDDARRVAERPEAVRVEERPEGVHVEERPEAVRERADVVPDADRVIPALRLLRTHAPDFVAEPQTVGRTIEGVITWKPGEPLQPVFPGAGMPSLASQALALVGAMSDLSDRVTDDLREMDFTVFGDRYRHLVEIASRMDDLRKSGAFDEPGLSDRLADIVFRCRLDPFEALAEEYKRRVRDVKHAQFLEHFLERHPGIQHKAGVPLGGTFILVYHELSKPAPHPRPFRPVELAEVGGLMAAERASRRALDLDESKAEELGDALARFQYKHELAEDPDLQLVYRLVTGNQLIRRPAVSSVATDVYLDAIARLPEGTVIADFFLPYQYCSDCATIEYQLPSARLRVTASKTCTNADGSEVTLNVEGASGSLSVQVDGGGFEELTGSLRLGAGDHTIVVRDATGNDSSPLEITIAPPLMIGGSETHIDRGRTYGVTFTIEGGTPPYIADRGTVADATYTSPVLKVDEVLAVVITDALGCTVEGRFESGVAPCDLPCEGVAERQGYRFWLPEARPNLPIIKYTPRVAGFTITGTDGNEIDLTARVNDSIQTPQRISAGDYVSVVKRWLDSINRVVAEAVGSDQWLRLEYEPAPETGTTGTVFVDRLECLDFGFGLSVEFEQGRRRRELVFEYRPPGTIVHEVSSEAPPFLIPPFGGSRSNKCRPEEPPVQLCEGTRFDLEIRREGVAPELALMAGVGGAADDDPVVGYLWEVQDGFPSVAPGEHVVVKFDRLEPVVKHVRLTAYTEHGCTVTVEKDINIVRTED